MSTAFQPRRRLVRAVLAIVLAAASASCADTSRTRYYRARACEFAPSTDTPFSPTAARAESDRASAADDLD